VVVAHDGHGLGHSYGVAGGFRLVPLVVVGAVGMLVVVVVVDDNTLQLKGRKTDLLQLHRVVVVRDNTAAAPTFVAVVDSPPSSHHWEDMPDHWDSNIPDGTMVEDPEELKEAHYHIHTLHHSLRVNEVEVIVPVP